MKIHVIRTSYLDKSCIFVNLKRRPSQLQFLHNIDGFIQIQNNSGGCDAEIGLKNRRTSLLEKLRLYVLYSSPSMKSTSRCLPRNLQITLACQKHVIFQVSHTSLPPPNFLWRTMVIMSNRRRRCNRWISAFTHAWHA